MGFVLRFQPPGPPIDQLENAKSVASKIDEMFRLGIVAVVAFIDVIDKLLE
jgi:hypothetical protein